MSRVPKYPPQGHPRFPNNTLLTVEQRREQEYMAGGFTPRKQATADAAGFATGVGCAVWLFTVPMNFVLNTISTLVALWLASQVFNFL